MRMIFLTVFMILCCKTQAFVGPQQAVPWSSRGKQEQQQQAPVSDMMLDVRFAAAGELGIMGDFVTNRGDASPFSQGFSTTATATSTMVNDKNQRDDLLVPALSFLAVGVAAACLAMDTSEWQSLTDVVSRTLVQSFQHDGLSLIETFKHSCMNVWDSYNAILAERPIQTKAVTSATVYTIGDVIAQRTEQEEEQVFSLDGMRVLRSLLAGLIGHGPLSHYWYDISESFFNDVLLWTAWWSFFPKVIIDQALWAPFWNNTYILMLGLMKGESWETIWGDVKRTTVPLVVSGLKLWPLAHCVTYGLVPVENRLLWVDVVEILWVTILATQAAGGAVEESEKKEQVAVIDR